MHEFELSYRENYRAVLAYLRRRSDGQIAEDLCAEVFARAWRGWPPQGNHLPWLYGIAHNVILEHYRGRDRDNSRDSELISVHSRTGQAAQSAEEIVTGPMRILDALATLAEADQEVLRLHTWEALSPEQMAVALQVSPATARVRLHRARKRLEEALRLDGEPPATKAPHNKAQHDWKVNNR
nr:sigma-70 family RNA polymerase sigma factor [Corynebacterium lactis]